MDRSTHAPVKFENGHVYRWLGRSYENIGLLNPVTIHFMRLNASVKTLRPKPEGIEVVEVALVDDATATARTRLRHEQFIALYQAVASTASWWPIEDPCWPWKSFFHGQKMVLMLKDELPIGFSCWQENETAEGATKINFVGVVGWAQGHGYGSWLFDYVCHTIGQQNPGKDILLDTAPQYDVMSNGAAALDMYAKKGFVEVTAPVEVAPSPADNMEEFTLNQFNLPAYYHQHPYYDDAALAARLRAAFTA